jgi:hypothetical protein
VLLVIPAEAGIYCAIGTGLRRCDEVDDTTTDTVSARTEKILSADPAPRD